jgi:hypothetical protein
MANYDFDFGENIEKIDKRPPKETQLFKAMNVCNTQLGSLIYNQDSGVDIGFFLNKDINFKKTGFIAYLTEQLIMQGIQVSDFTIEPVQDNRQKIFVKIKSKDNNNSIF